VSAARVLQFIVVANSAVLAGITIYVISLYGAVYAATKDHGARQLPLHVWMVATSLLGYVVTTSYWLITTPEPNGLMRAILYGSFGLLANVGLSNVLRYDRRKLTKATGYMEKVHPEDNPG